ncbi:hypothetical protein GCM10027406_18950 [Leifsonia lichenia]
MIGQFIADAVAWLVGGAVTDGITGSARRRAARDGAFLGGLRVVSGTQKGLSREWRIGEWKVRAGRLTLDEVEVPVDETVRGSRRDATTNELVGASATVVVSIRTETAQLEWSNLLQFEELALNALDVPAGTGSGPGPSTMDVP